MKKFVVLILCLLGMIIPFDVSATSGALKKDSIKTCPDGITYGYHKDGAERHWHVAVTNGENYYPSGDAILSDPCPGYTKNSGTAGSTSGGNTSSSSSSNNSSKSAPAPKSETEASAVTPAPVEPATVEDKEEVAENKEEKETEATETLKDDINDEKIIDNSNNDVKDADATLTKEVDDSNYEEDSAMDAIIGFIVVLGAGLGVGKIIKGKKKIA